MYHQHAMKLPSSLVLCCHVTVQLQRALLRIQLVAAVFVICAATDVCSCNKQYAWLGCRSPLCNMLRASLPGRKYCFDADAGMMRVMKSG